MCMIPLAVFAATFLDLAGGAGLALHAEPDKSLLSEFHVNKMIDCNIWLDYPTYAGVLAIISCILAAAMLCGVYCMRPRGASTPSGGYARLASQPPTQSDGCSVMFWIIIAADIAAVVACFVVSAQCMKWYVGQQADFGDVARAIFVPVNADIDKVGTVCFVCAGVLLVAGFSNCCCFEKAAGCVLVCTNVIPTILLAVAGAVCVLAKKETDVMSGHLPSGALSNHFIAASLLSLISGTFSAFGACFACGNPPNPKRRT